MSWYNKYRPSKFEEVIGQELVKSVLINAVAKNRIKHGYLLSGSKGVGKTTIARIFAGLINDFENNPEAKIDLFELNAASNTGVDDIRDLIEEAKAQPMIGKYKIFIIDEVHMLSKNAMNALLKILEEPPAHLIFLLATTDPQKLLPTVLSRLTKLPLQNHTLADLFSNLRRISDLEGVKIDDASLKLIAGRAGGSHRDSINLLETLASYDLPEYTSKEVVELLGLVPHQILEMVSTALVEGDMKSVLPILTGLGTDGQTFLAQMLDYLLDISLAGNLEMDELVVAVAEVLSLRLSLDSTISAVALVQAKLQTILGTTKTNFGTPKKKLTTDSALIPENGHNIAKIETKIETQVEIINQQLQQTQPDPKQIEKIDVKTDSNIDNLEAQKTTQQSPKYEIDQTYDQPSADKSVAVKEFLLNLANQNTVPPSLITTLKMVVASIVCQVEDGVAVLYTTNLMFQKQLENSSLKEFLTAQIQSQFSLKLQIATELVDRNLTRTSHSSPAQPNNADIDNNIGEVASQEIKDKPITKIKTENQEIKIEKKVIEQKGSQNNTDLEPSETEPKKVFYEIYQQYPPNWNGVGVELYTGNVNNTSKDEDSKNLSPEISKETGSAKTSQTIQKIVEKSAEKPTEKPAEKEKTWDEQAGEMFDFDI